MNTDAHEGLKERTSKSRRATFSLKYIITRLCGQSEQNLGPIKVWAKATPATSESRSTRKLSSFKSLYKSKDKIKLKKKELLRFKISIPLYVFIHF